MQKTVKIPHAFLDMVHARRCATTGSGWSRQWSILDLHRFFSAISRAAVNHDDRGGTAPDPMVWSAGALSKRRQLVQAVRDLSFLLGPPASAVCADLHCWTLG